MSFKVIANSTTTDANLMNAEFYHVAQGTILPRGGIRLEPTTGVYDLGSTTYKWYWLYANDIHVDNFPVCPDGKPFFINKISEIYTTTSRVEITGLNGDTYLQYELLTKLTGITNTSLLMYINGDSNTANYKYWLLHYTIISTGGASHNGILLNKVEGITTTGNLNSFANTILNPQTGHGRNGIINSCWSAINDYVYQIWQGGFDYIDTTTTITSLVFTTDTTTAQISIILTGLS